MQKNKFLKCTSALLAVISLLSLVACSNQSSSSQESFSGNMMRQAQFGKTAQTGQTEIYGKVTAVSGTKITLALGTTGMQSRQGAGGQGWQGGTPPNGGNGGTQGGTASNGDNGGTSGMQGGTPPNGGQGGAPGTQGTMPNGGAGRGMGALKLTGKVKTIIISDSSVISTFSIPNGSSSTASSSVSLSDIKVGSTLQVIYDTKTEKLTSVVIMSANKE